MTYKTNKTKKQTKKTGEVKMPENIFYWRLKGKKLKKNLKT